ATFISQITYWWMNGLIWRGSRRALERTDLWSLYRYDTSNVCIDKFSKNWEEEKAAKNISYYSQPSTMGSDDDVMLRTLRGEESTPLLKDSFQSSSKSSGATISSSGGGQRTK
ncbi:hypothetical protein, partial [Salmonella sp. s51228]|uniref:hypothetical protein n=1 Tax=Salmonella sp. s51228 TaxID=3159652 RepID=UPI00398162B5